MSVTQIDAMLEELAAAPPDGRADALSRLGTAIADACDEETARRGGLEESLRDELVRIVGPILLERASELERRISRDRAERWSDDYRRRATECTEWIVLLARLRPATPIWPAIATHPDSTIALAAVNALLGQSSNLPDGAIETIAADPVTRWQLARDLAGLDRRDLFPADWWTQQWLAESELVQWLMFPTELNAPPDEIALMQIVTVETEDGDADLYVYKFRTDPPHWASDKGWLVGVAGPYPRTEQPTTDGLGATFSRFERLDVASIDDHVAAIFKTLGLTN